MRVMLPGLLFGFSATAASAAPDVSGNWITQDRTARIAIAPCGKQMCGTIAKVLVDRPGIPKTDVHNPNAALRRRPIQGLRIISGMSPSDTKWEGGRIYDPNSGKSYKSYLQLREDGSLKVAGCIAFICRSQRWTRAR